MSEVVQSIDRLMKTTTPKGGITRRALVLEDGTVVEGESLRSENGGWWIMTQGHGEWYPSRKIERVEMDWATGGS